MGELEKAVEILTCGFCSHSISHSPINLHSCYNSIETQTDKDLYDKKNFHFFLTGCAFRNQRCGWFGFEDEF